MGKPGQVEIEVAGRPGAIERVRVGGVAVTVMRGALRQASVTRPEAAARG